jgi:hypothetical protein
MHGGKEIKDVQKKKQDLYLPSLYTIPHISLPLFLFDLVVLFIPFGGRCPNKKEDQQQQSQ